MGTVKKSITVEEELEKKLQKYRDKFGSTDSGIINIALKDYFKKIEVK